MGRDGNFQSCHKAFLLVKPEQLSSHLDAAGRSGRARFLRFRVEAALRAYGHGDSGAAAAPAPWEGRLKAYFRAGSCVCLCDRSLPSFRRGEHGSAGTEAFQLLGLWPGDWCKMERGAAAAGDGRNGPWERRGLGEAERQQQNQVRAHSGANQFPKQSYWLDLWLFILFDLVVFFFMYFLPCSR
nr:uncharacterized protein C4orf3 homolog isoform X1 [Camelus dromedarius]